MSGKKKKKGPAGCFSQLATSRKENRGTCTEEQTQMKGSRLPPNQHKMFPFFSGGGVVMEKCREIKSALRWERPVGHTLREEEESGCEVQGWRCPAELQRHWIQMKIHLFGFLNICRCFSSKIPQSSGLMHFHNICWCSCSYCVPPLSFMTDTLNGADCLTHTHRHAHWRTGIGILC